MVKIERNYYSIFQIIQAILYRGYTVGYTYQMEDVFIWCTTVFPFYKISLSYLKVSNQTIGINSLEHGVKNFLLTKVF